jgi:hypothetical protein
MTRPITLLGPDLDLDLDLLALSPEMFISVLSSYPLSLLYAIFN